MRLLFVLSLLLVLAGPGASAQTKVADVHSWVTPEAFTIDYTVQQVDGRIEPVQDRTLTLHVQGSIDCLPGTERPVPVQLQKEGPRFTLRQGGEEDVLLDVEPDTLWANWTDDGDGSWSIDATFALHVVNEAVPTVDTEGTYRWLDQRADPQGTTRCDPQGYIINVTGDPHTVLAPGYDPQPDGTTTTEGGQGAPFPALAAVLALALVAARKKR